MEQRKEKIALDENDLRGLKPKAKSLVKVLAEMMNFTSREQFDDAVKQRVEGLIEENSEAYYKLMTKKFGVHQEEEITKELADKISLERNRELSAKQIFSYMFAARIKDYQDDSNSEQSKTLIHHTSPFLLNLDETFNVSNSLSFMFEHSKNRIYYRELPFPIMFVNNKIELDDLGIINGIGLKQYYDEDNDFFVTLVISLMTDSKGDDDIILAFIKEDGEVLVPLPKPGEGNYKREEVELINKGANFMLNYVCNFLDFLNHPDIDIRTEAYPKEMNETRIRKGKSRIATNHHITCRGRTLVYLQKAESSGRIIKGFFGVRGHYVHFLNKRRYKRLYALDDDELKTRGYQTNSDGIILKWRLPFFKGVGLRKSREYDLK